MSGVVGIGIFFVVKGVRASFHDDLEPRDVGPISLEAIVVFGRVGWVGRGVVLVLVGWFVDQCRCPLPPIGRAWSRRVVA